MMRTIPNHKTENDLGDVVWPTPASVVFVVVYGYEPIRNNRLVFLVGGVTGLP